jgi:uncharacterized protein YndB with AHSA1/START domain
VEEPTVVHSTFVIERSYPKAPGRVFAAFADSAEKRRWFAEGPGHEVEEFESDFRAGGVERARYRYGEGTPIAGMAIAYEGIYQDIVPDRRVVVASSMTLGDRPMSAALVTVEFLPTDAGTDLVCTHQGAFFEGSDGPERREAGWLELFERLAKALEHQPELVGNGASDARS